jgi:putative ABC transport system substrate-binding protein
MNRREIIAGLGSAVALPVVARAQQSDRVRRIGVLLPYDEHDPLAKARVSAFAQALADLGWTDGRNMRMELRWGGGDVNRIRAVAQELVGLQPEIIVTNGTPATVAVQRETRTTPIVFVNVSDPVASSIVARLDRPGGNITGFATFEATLGGKWLELLSEIAPGLKRVAIMFNPDTAPVSVNMPSLETAAQSLKVIPIPAPIIATQISKRLSAPLGASREAALSSCRTGSRPCIARSSYWRRPETTYRRSMRNLTSPEMAVCSPTDLTR